MNIYIIQLSLVSNLVFFGEYNVAQECHQNAKDGAGYQIKDGPGKKRQLILA